MEREEARLETGPRNGAAASTERAARQWLVALVVVGVLARVLRYGLGFALWEDEAFLVVNLFEKDVPGLLGPLDFGQLAPPLWLLAEKAVAELLGFSEWSLRLVAFVSSLASLALFVSLARRLLAGWEATFAAGIFAVSYPCVRYAAEAKPYGVDLLVSVALLLAGVRLAEGARPVRWLLLAALLAIGPWLSFPSAFVGGGIVLLGLSQALAAAGPGHRVAAGAPWVAAGLLHVASLLAVQACIADAAAPTLPGMQAFWLEALPPFATPLRIPLWLLASLTGPLFAFPVGGVAGASVVTTVAVLGGVVLLAGSSRRPLIAFCTAPLALHLAAAALHRYPFGGHTKFSLYAVPLVSILAAVSLAHLASPGRGPGRRTDPGGGAVATFLLVIGLAVLARDLVWPYKNPSDEAARSFARGFWVDAALGAETVCLESDLGVSFQPELRSRLSWFATYRANQILYSPRHGRREAPRLDRVTAGRPLLLVEYRVAAFAYDQEGSWRWMEKTRTELTLVEETKIPVPRRDQHQRRLLTTDEIVLRRFVPR
ncbi:MAG: glycosyltransferase family 39 protein [Holophagales bacterium]|nr:glycosyltransferase family 39 protein [Holophagales bacterium]